MTDEPERMDNPNQQTVRPDQSGPSDEGSGGGKPKAKPKADKPQERPSAAKPPAKGKAPDEPADEGETGG